MTARHGHYVPRSVVRLLQHYADTPPFFTGAISSSSSRGVHGKTAALPRRLKHTDPNARRYVVLLNGVVQRLCTVADVEYGYVERYLRGRGSTPTTFHTERVHGKVEIKWRKHL